MASTSEVFSLCLSLSPLTGAVTTHRHFERRGRYSLLIHLLNYCPSSLSRHGLFTLGSRLEKKAGTHCIPYVGLSTLGSRIEKKREHTAFPTTIHTLQQWLVPPKKPGPKREKREQSATKREDELLVALYRSLYSRKSYGEKAGTHCIP